MINKPIDYRFGYLSQEDIYELIIEIIPGINHKSNNLLTKISGQVLLDHMQDETKMNNQNSHTEIAEFCDHIAKLLDKMLLMIYSSEKTSQSTQASECLSNSIARFQETHPSRIVTLNNILPDDCQIWGEYYRIQRCYFFILMMLNECITPTDKICIDCSMIQTSSESSVNSIKSKNVPWIQVLFKTNSGGSEIELYNNDFYDPEEPINLISCYQTAAENIIIPFGGRIQIKAQEDIQIITQYPLLEESIPANNRQGAIQTERAYFNPINRDNTISEGKPLES